jgi:ESCRT-I complex subunit VPS28
MKIYRLILLNGMKASDELNEEQLRQLMFDIEHAYAEFFRSLGGTRDGSDS